MTGFMHKPPKKARVETGHNLGSVKTCCKPQLITLNTFYAHKEVHKYTKENPSEGAKY